MVDLARFRLRDFSPSTGTLSLGVEGCDIGPDSWLHASLSFSDFGQDMVLETHGEAWRRPTYVFVDLFHLSSTFAFLAS